MNDRLVEVFSAEFLAALSGAGNPDPSPIFILGLPRSGSTLLEQILASHPAGRGHGRAALRRPACDLVEPEPQRRRELPRGDARAVAGKRRGARHAIPRAGPDAPALGRAAIHRQDAEQLPERRVDRGDAAKRADRRRPPAPAGRLPVLLEAAVRQGPELHLRPDRDRRVLRPVPADDGPLGARAAGRRADRAVRGSWSPTSSPRCGGCWSSAACPRTAPACVSGRATGRCARRRRSRCAGRSTTARSGTSGTTSTGSAS